MVIPPTRTSTISVSLADSHDAVVSGWIAIAIKDRGALLDGLINAVAGYLERLTLKRRREPEVEVSARHETDAQRERLGDGVLRRL